jgi:O-antigen/teichoic acid export membrane protein
MLFSPNNLVSHLKNVLFINRSTKQIIVKNTFWLMAAEVVAKFLLFVITISVIRYLGAVAYGKYSFAVAFTSMFSVIVDFGLGTMLLQELTSTNKKNASHIFGSILTVKFFLGLIAFFLIFLISLFLNVTPDVHALILLGGIYMIIQSFVLLFPFLFQAYEAMQYNFIVRTGSNILLVIFVLSAIYLHLSVNAIFYAYILTAIFMLLVCFFLVRKHLFSSKFGIDTLTVKYFLKQSWPLFFGNVCLTLYMFVDTTMLGFFRNYQEVGIYQSAYKILYVFQTLSLIHTVLYPRMAVLYRESKDKLHTLLKLSISISLVVLLPVIAVIGVYRNQLVSLIYGAKFQGVGDVMILLIIGGAISYFCGFFGGLLLIKRKQKQWFLALLISLIANILVNYFTIPRFGPIGAGIGYIVGYVMLLIALMIQ